jgi:hypothetical protein
MDGCSGVHLGLGEVTLKRITCHGNGIHTKGMSTKGMSYGWSELRKEWATEGMGYGRNGVRISR